MLTGQLVLTAYIRRQRRRSAYLNCRRVLEWDCVANAATTVTAEQNHLWQPAAARVSGARGFRANDCSSRGRVHTICGTRAKTVGKRRAAREREVSANDAGQKGAGVNLPLLGAAQLFTHHWLAAALEAVKPRHPPLVTNSAGDPLVFVTVHFPLASGATHDAVREALAAVPGLRQETGSFWNWVEEPGTSQPTRRRPKAQQFITTMDDGAIVLGNLELKARRLSLTANSEARATRGQALLAGALGGLVRAPLVERDDMRLSPARAREQPPQPSSLTPEVERQVISQAMDDHYRRILDEPIPALGNRSPRSATKTPKGREKVVAWLKRLENHGARHDPDDPMAGYDFGWMWRELGVEHLRQ